MITYLQKGCSDSHGDTVWWLWTDPRGNNNDDTGAYDETFVCECISEQMALDIQQLLAGGKLIDPLTSRVVE